VTARQRATHHGTAVLRGDPVRPHEWGATPSYAEIGGAQLQQNGATPSYAATAISPRRSAPAAPGPGGPQLEVPWLPGADGPPS
jgi:hypothetical protein